MINNAAAAPAAPAEILDPGGGANQVRVRAYNERLVMSLVRRHGSLSKADIARRSGLSAQTVTVIMRALERDGFVARSVSPDVPPRVSYRLTALGEGLHAQARAMIDWVNSQAPAIAAARRAFDSEERG